MCGDVGIKERGHTNGNAENPLEYIPYGVPSTAANRADVPPRVRRVEWSPDGNYLAASTEGGVVLVWNADGSILVSAGSDGSLRWWHPQNGRCLMSRPGHEGPVNSLRASPDGRLLASCGDDGAIRIWGLVSGEQITSLRRDRPYERLNMTGIKGLTEAQKLTLKMMGAVEQPSEVA